MSSYNDTKQCTFSYDSYIYSYQLVAKTSTWQNTKVTRDRIQFPAGFLKHLLNSQNRYIGTESSIRLVSYVTSYTLSPISHTYFSPRVSSWNRISIILGSHLEGGALYRVSIDDFSPAASVWLPGTTYILRGAWSLYSITAIGVVAAAFGRILNVIVYTVSPYVSVVARVEIGAGNSSRRECGAGLF